MNKWIDFTELRKQLKFEDVLRHFKIEIKAKGVQHHGYCPLPKHKGKKNSVSFSANLEKGIFNCFGCGAKGNLLDFAALMQGLDPESGADVRTAALALQEAFRLGTPQPEAKPKPKERKVTEEQAELHDLRVAVNAPLDFELKNLDARHPYLDKRGFDGDTIAHFGLGYCAKGMLAGRIAIPLHAHATGKLIGYAGRLVDNTAIREDNPKYRFPGAREREGVKHEFRKSEILYNSNRLKSPVAQLVVVEGFASVWWLHQMGISNVVALMGWAVSEEQTKIVTELVHPTGRIVVVGDGDDAGKRCALSVFESMGQQRFIKWLKLDEGKQPTDYPGGWLRDRLGE